MPHPTALLSTYSSEDLDYIINRDRPNELHIYVDIKNAMTSMFVEDVCQELITLSAQNKFMDSSIFQSFIWNAAYWKGYATRNRMACKIFFFTDIGKSALYHLRIDRDYKKNRDIKLAHTSATLPTYASEKLKGIRDQNFNLAEIICNKIKDVYFINLKDLESDFVAYFLMSRRFKDRSDILNIIHSSDHDLFQNLLLPANTVQMFKIRGTRVVMDSRSIFSTWAKLEKASDSSKSKRYEIIGKLDPNYYPSMMAITGDVGDDVPGIKGFGPLTVIDMYKDPEIVNAVIGSPQELDDRIAAGGKFCKPESEMLIHRLGKSKWKNVIIDDDIVTRSYKLVSFEQLCRRLENPECTEQKDRINYIDRILTKSHGKEIPSTKSFMYAIDKLSDSYLTESVVAPLFEGENNENMEYNS